MKKIYKILIFLIFVIAALIAVAFSVKAFFPNLFKKPNSGYENNLISKYMVMPPPDSGYDRSQARYGVMRVR